MSVKAVDPQMSLKQYLQVGSQKELAGLLGISPQYLSDLLRGRRQFSERMLNKLSLTRIVVSKRDVA